MQVTRVEHLIKTSEPTAARFTQEQLQQEFNYMQAERVTSELLEKGIISTTEYDRIMAENKKVFPTFLASIL